ncbi:protein lplB [Paenibacillus sp. MY03]|jgi:putative aldouronate transport system permease protein|uniref:ABC transporter permease n=1 Tax=Paenibacillus sp. MY03 TaxID=302980 RepID=UPI000B3CC6D6|nr:sugar ABC transporter permease [Paenibacillus sp. MY03]OUS76680.1 protein lplB [Paenibacillus sp. MY03]
MNVNRLEKPNDILRELYKNSWLYLMLIPGLVYFLIFKYWPMWGLVMSFQNFKPHLGISGSEWVGLEHFIRLFSEPQFFKLFRNTAVLALYNICFFFPIPIILALMLNEVRVELFKRSIQTVIYIPHFVSWVVIVGISYMFLTTEGGIINDLIAHFGFEKIPFLLSEEWFRTLITGQTIWKEAGWGTIIYLAALSGIDMQLYEAAKMDGANRWRQMWHITLPGIRGTIIILFILKMGDFLDVSFEQVFLVLNTMNREVGEVFDTYVYTKGLTQAQYSYSAAVGVFKSVFALVLVLGTNWLAKKAGEEGIY